MPLISKIILCCVYVLTIFIILDKWGIIKMPCKGKKKKKKRRK